MSWDGTKTPQLKQRVLKRSFLIRCFNWSTEFPCKNPTKMKNPPATKGLAIAWSNATWNKLSWNAFHASEWNECKDMLPKSPNAYLLDNRLEGVPWCNSFQPWQIKTVECANYTPKRHYSECSHWLPLFSVLRQQENQHSTDEINHGWRMTKLWSLI